MTVIKEQPVPLYFQKCDECGSLFTYTRSETNKMSIVCPVCGVELWAHFERIKKLCLYKDEEEGEADE